MPIGKFSSISECFFLTLLCWLGGSIRCVLAESTTRPDKVFVNGLIVTMVHPDAIAEAVAIEDGKIIAVGDNEDIRGLADSTTTIIAGGAGGIVPELLGARERGWLHLRVNAMSSGIRGTPPTLESLAKLSPVPERIRVSAVKLSQDGSLQGYTGFLSSPYHQQPEGKSQYAGYPARSRENLVEMVKNYHRAGYQIAIHGNGDAAIDDILYAYREAQAEFPRPDARHRIEHCQTPRDDQLDQIRELGVTPSFFIAHVYYWGDRHRDLFLGPDRAERISPLASARERGIRFTIHNDTPVTPVDPLHLVWCAVNRQTRNGEILGPEQRIDTYAALQAVTIDAAWQNFEENIKGTIELGKLADFVILAENPLTVERLKLKDIQVVETIVGGESMFHGSRW